MTNYPTMFDPIPWPEVGISFLQTMIIYWLVLLGLKWVGRRSLGQLGPQELILLLLISEATDLGITHTGSGFWGSVASVVALLLTVYGVDRIRPLSKLLDAKPVVIARHGKIEKEMTEKFCVDKEDLERVARQYGVSGIEAFETMMLEGDGRITGVLDKSLDKPLTSFNQGKTR